MKLSLSLTFLLSLISLTLPTAHAASLKSPQFTIELGKPAPELSPTPSPMPTPTPFQNRVETGQPIGKEAKPLRLTLSADLLDFGILTATNPVKRSLTVSVDPGAAVSYSLFSYENHPPRNEGDTIPATSCDDGTCTASAAAHWINPFTFGFGFSYNDISYLQFADFSQSQPMATILPGKLTVKLNANRQQILPQGGRYENTITFLAIPDY